MFCSCFNSITKRISQACEDSFINCDFTLVKLLCEESKQAWKIVRSLNVEDAENIFKVKNQNNGILKIDLHDFHRSEAIEATKQRLK